MLRVSSKVVALPDIVVSHDDAASDYAPPPRCARGLAIMNRELTFAESWPSHDQIDQWRRSLRKCAEVLPPDAVPAHFIEGAYVSCDDSLAELRAVAPNLPIEVNRHLFFL